MFAIIRKKGERLRESTITAAFDDQPVEGKSRLVIGRCQQLTAPHTYLNCTPNNFPFMCFQKRFNQVSLLKSVKYFQNRIIMFCLELSYSVEKYITRCNHSTVSIGNNIFPNRIMKLLQRWSLDLLLPLLQYKFGICD
jgi:hypothetical protein